MVCCKSTAKILAENDSFVVIDFFVVVFVNTFFLMYTPLHSVLFSPSVEE